MEGKEIGRTDKRIPTQRTADGVQQLRTVTYSVVWRRSRQAVRRRSTTEAWPRWTAQPANDDLDNAAQ